jgi:hypothetical protein
MPAAALLACVGHAEAGLVHRYTFAGSDASDAVGTVDGSLTVSGTYLEAPQFVTDQPAGAVTGAPTQAMEVGMNVGALKSAAVIPFAALDKEAGSLAFWLKPDTAGHGRYILHQNWRNGLGVIQYSTTAEVVSVVTILDDDGTAPYGGNPASQFNMSSPFTSEWHFVAITWRSGTSGSDAGEFVIYFDDQAPAYRQYPAEWESVWPTSGLRFGTFNETDSTSGLANQFDGRIYDIQVYDASLAAWQIEAMYTNPGSEAPLVPEPVGLAVLGLSSLAVGGPRRRK